MSFETVLKFEFGTTMIARAIIIGLLSGNLFFVKGIYTEWQNMKQETADMKKFQAVQVEVNKEFDRRITKIEPQQ